MMKEKPTDPSAPLTEYGLTAIGFSRYTPWDESETIPLRSRGEDLGEEWIHDY